MHVFWNPNTFHMQTDSCNYAWPLPTMRSNGSCVCAALSSSSLYSSSSHSLCSVLSGSLSWTGMATLDRSFPMLFFSMFHRLMLLVLGLGEGRQDRRCSWEPPFSTQPKKGNASKIDLQQLSLWKFLFCHVKIACQCFFWTYIILHTAIKQLSYLWNAVCTAFHV